MFFGLYGTSGPLVMATRLRLQKSFSFNKTVEITGHALAKFICELIAVNTCYVFPEALELDSF